MWGRHHLKGDVGTSEREIRFKIESGSLDVLFHYELQVWHAHSFLKIFLATD